MNNLSDYYAKYGRPKPIPHSICDDCLNAECVWRAPSWGIDPPVMDCPDKKVPPTTNADRVRSMTDEELAKWLDYEYGRCEWCNIDKIGTDDCSDVDCTACILDWLKEEYKE